MLRRTKVTLPQRVSLTEQVVAILRDGIVAGHWSREMPSEAELCRELQISRVTLRKAIAQLVRERLLIPGGRGLHCRIRRKSSAREENTGRTVRVLSPRSVADMGTVHTVTIETLAERLSAKGYRVEFEHRPQLFQRHRAAALRHLDSLPDTAGWILFFAPAPMQQWFAANERPCVIAGVRHEGVNLPCVYPDSRALGHHAAGRLVARGHRELVLFTAKAASAGSALTAEAFEMEARRLGANVQIIQHENTVADVREHFSRTLAMRPRPTGFVSTSSVFAITLLCGLLLAGIRVPEDAAVIAGWEELAHDYTTPTITRYRTNGVNYGRKLAATFLETLRNSSASAHPVRIMPEFVKGGTL